MNESLEDRLRKMKGNAVTSSEDLKVKIREELGISKSDFNKDATNLLYELILECFRYTPQHPDYESKLKEKLSEYKGINQKIIQRIAHDLNEDHQIYEEVYELGTKVGFLLTKLIEVSEDSELIIHLPNGSLIHSFGYELSVPKVIDIKGDIGGSCGARMEEGTIIVRGNAGNFLGNEMKGGTIKVYGKIDKTAGTMFRWGGQIYHKDKLIFPEK